MLLSLFTYLRFFAQHLSVSITVVCEACFDTVLTMHCNDGVYPLVYLFYNSFIHLSSIPSIYPVL